MSSHRSSRHDPVLYPFRILEVERVITGRRVFRILSGCIHDGGAYPFYVSIQAIDFGPRCRSECKMMQRPWFPAIDRLPHEIRSRRCDGEPEAWMLVRDDML